ncbi:MAG TPA: tetratricopeptide repeat protein [Gemmatimonadaceae bacterium]|jgi:tetratricopeptide (TPR) repeat protein
MDYDRLRELQQKFEENPRRYFAPLANEYRKGGQPKRAIEICRAQLPQMPGHMSGQIVYAQALYEAGEFDEARQVFERALILDPENLIALRTLGDMSLQGGNTAEARRWYTRLLDADPKDSAVIALVTEIDASADAAVPVAEVIPGVDVDAGDQAIPYISAEAATTASPAPESAAATPAASSTASSEAGTPPQSFPAAASAAEPAPAATESAAPAGLERHYPVEPTETIIPAQPMGAEGLRGKTEIGEPIGAEGLRGNVEAAAPAAVEGLRGTEPEVPEPVGAEGLKGKPPVLPLEGATASRSDDEEALDTWTPPPGAAVHERAESKEEDRMFSGPAAEPFVNETMAQLYLQQGYRQLALRVYYQLAEARPNDQALKDRIAQIEAEDRAAHPEMAAEPRRERPSAERVSSEARRELPPIERPSPEPTAPRSPSIESPTPGAPPESEEAPSFDRSPVDSPPTSQPSRRRESVEAPVREEPHAEPEGIAARQPSIKEFFATLGRRRPPRPSGGVAGGGGGIRSGNSIPPEAPPAASALGSAVPGASLDAVFAGATVNPADSRAASRLAGAFSGVTGTSRTPPTPPVPTPRVNPRIPATQESEEDVAKFRAWLDGLTGE